ncbi:hypothetical protein [Arthrobacter sp. H5]|uniref:hypothetical protein n=1 Tax=Arthrobacter sp. H5 TaxID=1267973 RepID=UPI0004837CFE|nr:hypothetical protein [Arthrobacter sp. H5]
MGLSNIIKSAAGRLTGRTGPTGTTGRGTGTGRLNTFGSQRTAGRNGMGKPGSGGVSAMIRGILNRR